MRPDCCECAPALAAVPMPRKAFNPSQSNTAVLGWAEVGCDAVWWARLGVVAGSQQEQRLTKAGSK